MAPVERLRPWDLNMTSCAALMLRWSRWTSGQALVAFGEYVVPSQRLSVVDDSVQWGGQDGEDIKINPPSVVYRDFELRMAKEQDLQVRAGLEAVREELRQAEPPGEDGE